MENVKENESMACDRITSKFCCLDKNGGHKYDFYVMWSIFNRYDSTVTHTKSNVFFGVKMIKIVNQLDK